MERRSGARRSRRRPNPGHPHLDRHPARRSFGESTATLFDSAARGDAGPNSDYDLMVIVPEDAPPELRSEDLAYRTLRGTGTAADVLVWSRNNFDRQLHLKASLPSTIVREGKILYGAA
ncbi:MAG: nucleotidyltransferase domain-containing protein [Bryobacteraceae bacterium]